MSAFLNAANERLTATVSSGPLETDWKLIAAWVKRPTSEAVGSINIAYHLSHDGGGLGGASVWLAGGVNSTPAWVGRGGNATGATTIPPVTFGSDAWVLTGVLVGPNTGSGSALLKTYVDGATGSTTCGNTATSARQLTNLCLGSTASDTSARWRGHIAEVAVFIPSSEANADAIMADLSTTTADAIASGAPVWYAPLLSDGVATVGSDATVGGTATFDADHPTLSGGGGTPPSGTVTIGTITRDHDSASVPWTYDAADQTGFEYSLNSGAWTAAGTSPLALSGLTPETAYSVQIRAVNASGSGAASTPGEFTTDAEPSTPVAFDDGNPVPDLTTTVGAAFSLNLASRFSGTATPFVYTVQAGTLPDGLSIVGSAITGTPTTLETQANIVIRATDDDAAFDDTNAFSITVGAAPAAGAVIVNLIGF